MGTKTLEQTTAHKFAGLQIDLLQRLRNGNMTIEQFEYWNSLTFKQRAKVMGIQTKTKPILKLISGAEELVLSAVNGVDTLLAAKEREHYQGLGFGTRINNEKAQPTDETPIEIFELLVDAAVSKIFSSFNCDLSDLCFTQHQILNFIEKYRDWHKPFTAGTSFLIKLGADFLVITIWDPDMEPLTIGDSGLVTNSPLYGVYRPRIVVPKLAIQ